MELFRVAFTHKQLKKDKAFIEANGVVLERLPWDDHGYRCSFRVVAFERAKPIVLGEWKIVEPTSRPPCATELPEEFEALDQTWASLGQSRECYDALGKLPLERRRSILHGLRDLVYRPRPGVGKTRAYCFALARFSEAQEVLRSRGELMSSLGLEKRTTGKRPGPMELELAISTQLGEPKQRYGLRFSFSGQPGALGLRRAVVVVGPNGSGKTQLLAELSRAFSGLEARSTKIEPYNPFRLAIAVSFSAFDRFTRPHAEGGRLSYRYVGLREGVAPARDHQSRLVLDTDAAISRTVARLRELLATADRRASWISVMKTLELDELARTITRRPAEAGQRLRKLSAGTQAVVMVVTHLSRFLKRGAVVLFDEPEVHLHPRLLAALLRAVRWLLEEFDAYAILATHSLIVVQETPAQNVVVLRSIEGAGMFASRPAAQCFASPLDEIERAVFGAREQDVNYQVFLAHLMKTQSRRKLDALLGGDLGIGVRLALAEREK